MDPITDWKTGSALRAAEFSFADVADALVGAAHLLEQEGWCQKKLFVFSDRRAGPCQRCVRGALMDAVGVFQSPLLGLIPTRSTREFALYTTAETALLYWLADTDQLSDGEVVPEWNDASGRTQDEVVGALRACAEFVRSGDGQASGSD